MFNRVNKISLYVPRMREMSGFEVESAEIYKGYTAILGVLGRKISLYVPIMEENGRF